VSGARDVIRDSMNDDADRTVARVPQSGGQPPRRRIGRWIMRLIGIAPLVFGVALLTFSLLAWWRSHRVGDVFAFIVAIDRTAHQAKTRWIIESHRGRALVRPAQRIYGLHGAGHADLNGAYAGWHHRTRTTDQAWWALRVPPYRNRWEVPGLAVAAPPLSDAAGNLRVIVIGFAWWSPAACGATIILLSLAPAAIARRRRRRRQQYQRDQGRCPRCGYDLRASSTRCPECGFAPAGDAE
jgi:hypothetical protein